MENLKEAMQYIASLSNAAERAQVMEICGRTYVNKDLRRMDSPDQAKPLVISSLEGICDYIAQCGSEFRGPMILHVESPKRVSLFSELDQERKRETLVIAEANVSYFDFDRWMDQEEFITRIQSEFASEMSDDKDLVQKFAGNVVQKLDNEYSDDGTMQQATMKTGLATKENVIVPNPVELTPYRTFQELPQPTSKFVLRVKQGESPMFKLVEADNNIWKNQAVSEIKQYLMKFLKDSNINIAVIG